MNHSTLFLAHSYWKNHLRPGDCVIDATAGNGHDTVYLAQLLQGDGKLIAYDIQKEALFQTEKRLKALSEVERSIVFLKNASHIQFDEPVVQLIVYNLGYLPGGDHTLTTRTETTLQSVQSALDVLSAQGAISITCYPGHPEGKREQEALFEFLTPLSSCQWSVRFHQWINRPRSPTLFWIEPVLPRS